MPSVASWNPTLPPVAFCFPDTLGVGAGVGAGGVSPRACAVPKG